VPVVQRRWFVLQRRCNHSAFSGYRYTSSDYSCVQCHACGTVWRTKAAYVRDLKDGRNLYDLAVCKGCGGRVDKDLIKYWAGFCDGCLASGRNFEGE
jgi:hypothetical protein